MRANFIKMISPIRFRESSVKRIQQMDVIHLIVIIQE